MVAFTKDNPIDASSVNSAIVRNNFNALFEGDFEPLRVRAQSTPDMTVQVEDDNNRAYVEGNTALDYAGGNSPSFTAPAGANEKQIAILTLDKDGTLAITSGTPTTGTPVPPDYPSDKMVLVEIYLRNGMSSIKNTDDATNGYIFKVRTPVFNLGGGVPAGAQMPYGGDTAPSGFLLCDFGEYSRTTYAALFAKIGTKYGVGDGSTTFNVPDKRGRGSIGKDNMGGTSANRVTASQADNVGQGSGAENHILTTAELATHNHSHSHTNNALYVSGGSGYSGGANGILTGSTIDTDSTNAGSGNAHNNMAPYETDNWIIKT